MQFMMNGLEVCVNATVTYMWRTTVMQQNVNFQKAYHRCCLGFFFFWESFKQFIFRMNKRYSILILLLTVQTGNYGMYQIGNTKGLLSAQCVHPQNGVQYLLFSSFHLSVIILVKRCKYKLEIAVWMICTWLLQIPVLCLTVHSENVHSSSLFTHYVMLQLYSKLN